jgi:hypothetical protein
LVRPGGEQAHPSRLSYSLLILWGSRTRGRSSHASGGRVIEGSGLGAPLTNAGAPTNNVTYLGVAVVGSRLIDTSNGKAYICTGTNGTSTITWTVVGAQT